jgi:hypothetical protein
LLEAFAAKADPELRDDIGTIEEDLWQGGLFEVLGIGIRD